MASLLLRGGPAESAVATIWYSRAAATATAAVWKVNGDGTGDVKITDGYWPRLSPNGRYLLFHVGTASNPALTSVYLRDLQTNDETLALNHQSDYIVHYDFTANSSRVVFDYSCGIYETDRDGSNGKPLVNSDCYDDAPMVNPSTAASCSTTGAASSSPTAMAAERPGSRTRRGATTGRRGRPTASGSRSATTRAMSPSTTSRSIPTAAAARP
jgi:hypothetical protein